MCSIWAAFRCLKNQILRLYMRYKKQGMLLYYSTIKKKSSVNVHTKNHDIIMMVVGAHLTGLNTSETNLMEFLCTKDCSLHKNVVKKRKKICECKTLQNLKEEGQITTSGSKSHSSHWNWTVLRQFKSSPIFNKCKPRNRERVDLTNTYKSICIRPSPLM